MKIYTEVGDDIGSVELIDCMGGDITVVNAARVSFGKNVKEMSDKDEKLIKYLLEHNHWSPFEHVLFQFRIKVPLFVRAQHMGHKWAFNEISRRYTDENLEFYLPKKFRKQHESNRQASTEEYAPSLMSDLISPVYVADCVKGATEDCVITYEELLIHGVAREQARMVLPQNLYTEYYATCSLRSLIHFLQVRIHVGSQWEITKMAEAMYSLAKPLVPITLDSWYELNE